MSEELLSLTWVAVWFFFRRNGYRLPLHSREKDDLFQETVVSLLEKEYKKADEDGLSLEQLDHLFKVAQSKGLDFKETDGYETIFMTFQRKARRAARRAVWDAASQLGTTFGHRVRRGLPQEVPFGNYDPADRHESWGNQAKRRNGGKRWNGEPYDLRGSSMATMMQDKLIDLNQALAGCSELERDIVRGRIERKTDPEIGEELGMDRRRVQEIRQQIAKKLARILSK